ncbi:hypothetical protein XIS1_1440033 [Xenorhabdus innexi]|uniref:Uncharacterized protein n=1 Tax=Xenorhabdus innexi TaxID=290109 RepID=A0A1N6MU72_9GAMM|nr:hypothetical protein XIS1_1440033 [Xenorhabdus innexi]
MLFGQQSVFLNAQQHMGWLAAIGDKDGTVLGGFLCTGHILIQFPAGEGRDGHGGISCLNSQYRNITTI